MKTALLIYKGEEKIIEIPNAIYNLYMEREDKCANVVDDFTEKLKSYPKNALIINHPEIFENCEFYEDKEADEILDGYFYQKGKELFDFNIDEVFPEGYLPIGKEDIKIEFVEINSPLL